MEKSSGHNTCRPSSYTFIQASTHQKQEFKLKKEKKKLVLKYKSSYFQLVHQRHVYVLITGDEQHKLR